MRLNVLILLKETVEAPGVLGMRKNYLGRIAAHGGAGNGGAND